MPMIQEVLELHTWPKPQGRFSGYQYTLMHSGQVIETGHGGRLGASAEAAPATPDSVFDLASVTKLYTATLASILHDAGEVDLDAPIGDWVAVGAELSQTTSRELLTHVSGLPPWWEEQSTRASTISKLYELAPSPQQRGELVYSCTGYSMYAMSLEQKYGTTFDQILRARLLDPLGLEETVFSPSGERYEIVTAKEPKEDVPPGKVHDPRARALDGISGNAGLFANSTQVARFLDALAGGDSAVITAGVRRQLFTPSASSEWEQAIGFRFQDVGRLGSASHFFSHSGFTGTLAMTNPETSVSGVLLTNRLQCDTTREQMAEVYVSFSEWVGRHNG